ncbi:MAG TPA: Tn3 family transposase [Runella sp.]|nr:Tn3 family transposase [Runella sp.]
MVKVVDFDVFTHTLRAYFSLILNARYSPDLMPTLRPILSRDHQREFETPPTFNYAQRRFFFQITPDIKTLLATFETTANKTGFLVQLGYFRATCRFFSPTTFLTKDWEFAARRVTPKGSMLPIRIYADTTARRHRQLILQALGVMPFTGAVGELCQQEANELVTQGLRPPQVFGRLCDFLRTHRMEIPAYSTFVDLIQKANATFEAYLNEVLQTQLDDVGRQALLTLLEQPQDGGMPIYTTAPMQLTRLRNTQELMGSKAIRENVRHLQTLKKLYHQCLPVLKALALHEAVVEEYALEVMRSRSWQVKRWVSRELHLLCFIQYQYFYLNDVLAKTFVKATENNVNQCEKRHRIERQERYEHNLSQLADILGQYIGQADRLNQLQLSSYDFSKSLDDKFKLMLDNLRSPQTADFLARLPLVRDLYTQTTHHLKDADYYDQIAQGSQKLQNRVADLIRYLDFHTEPTGEELAKAIRFFQQKDGVLTGAVPTDFLKPAERANVFAKDGKLRTSLYKSLLARHIMRGFKAGSVFLPTSHQYKSIDDYLIDKATWQSQKLTLLERAGMRHLECWETVADELRGRLKTQIKQTIDRIETGENLWVEKRKDGNLRFKTPVLDELPEDSPVDLFPQDRVIPLYEVLETVNRISRFTETFQSARTDTERDRPPANLFLAGVIGMGCNLTIGRIAKTAKNLSPSALETTVRNYFNSVNLQRANDSVSALIERMTLGNLFNHNPHGHHTSSDGQKFAVAFDSIHSTYSAKYFGKEKGITIYSFINAVHDLFYSTAFSASDREAWYVIDGLMHNDVVRSEIHTTDTHGATDPVFSLSYLLGIDFQPRLADLYRQKLHGMAGVELLYSAADYELAIGEEMDEALVGRQWDRILRLLVSIKLKHTLASQVMKRLNSYALQNPLYGALKELGKVVRSLFVLRYMDDEQMRHRAHQQQEKNESANALGRAVTYGNNGVLQYANQEELLTLQGCKRLIENCVICWNYLYLSRLLVKSTKEEQAILVALLPRTSPVAWEHINFHGEFNFEDEQSRDPLEASLSAILMYEPEGN